MSTILTTVRPGSLRDRILTLLKSKPEGLTAKEIAAELGADIMVVRPRVSEMKKAGILKETGDGRPGPTKRRAKVLVVVEA